MGKPRSGLAPYFLGPVVMVSVLTRPGLLLAVLVALVACTGGATGQGTPSSVPPISLGYEHSSGALVIEADTYGGLMHPAMGRHVPELSIYGDGLVVLGREAETVMVATDRTVMTGHMGGDELNQLLSFIADQGFFQLDKRYVPSPAVADMPERHVTVNLLHTSKTVSVYPFDFADAPGAFESVYERLADVHPADAAEFTPASGTLTSTDLGPIDDLPSGQRSQVAPWDTPLLGITLGEAVQGAQLEGDQFGIVHEFLLRYPPGQLFGSQEGRAYRVLLEADFPWEQTAP